jgi:hypothetical protein
MRTLLKQHSRAGAYPTALQSGYDLQERPQSLAIRPDHHPSLSPQALLRRLPEPEKDLDMQDASGTAVNDIGRIRYVHSAALETDRIVHCSRWIPSAA